MIKHNKLDIQEGDIILVHSKKGFIPKAIRYFTKCHYNHAALVVEGLGGKLYVLEAVENGFILTKSLDKYIAETPRVREILVKRPYYQTFDKVREFYNRIDQIIGNKYDFKSLLFSQLIWQVTNKKKWKGKKDIKAAKRIYCSEACAFAYPSLFPSWWNIAPSDLYESDKLQTTFKL